MEDVDRLLLAFQIFFPAKPKRSHWVDIEDFRTANPGICYNLGMPLEGVTIRLTAWAESRRPIGWNPPADRWEPPKPKRRDRPTDPGNQHDMYRSRPHHEAQLRSGHPARSRSPIRSEGPEEGEVSPESVDRFRPSTVRRSNTPMRRGHDWVHRDVSSEVNTVESRGDREARQACVDRYQPRSPRRSSLDRDQSRGHRRVHRDVGSRAGIIQRRSRSPGRRDPGGRRR